MMKKKVKKIPKYNGGVAAAGKAVDLTIKRNPAGDAYNKKMLSDQSNSDGASLSMNGIATASNELLTNTFGIDDNSQAGVTLNAAAQGADIGGSIVPGWGHLIGGVAGGLIGSFKRGSVDVNTGEITSGGIFGRSMHSLKVEQNRIKNSMRANSMTEDLKAEYANNPNVIMNPNVLAAEGGIVPGEHYASRGEVEVAADGTNAVRYKWDPKGKDTYHVMFNPDGTPTVGNMIFTDEGVRRPNGEKYSDAAEKIIKSTKEGSKLRQISLRKLVNEMEEQKMNKGIQKIKKGIPAHEEGLNPYSYNKNLEEFTYWDKDKKAYKKEYLDWVNNLTEQDVRDIEAGKYGDMTEYFSKNKGKKLDVATAQKLMTDKKYGNWHKIGKMFVDSKISNLNDVEYSIKPVSVNLNKLTGIKASDASDPLANLENDLMRPIVPKIEGKNYWGRALKRNLPKIGQVISDWSPALAALFGDYDYHTEQPQISTAKYIPTSVNIDPIRRTADESYAMARYNQANISPNTGAGMAYGLQAAANRAKTLADAYIWQQDAQNKLIAQNAGIYNDWAKRYDAARYQAIADTRANEGAAQQMRSQAIKDAYEFQTGRRNDRWKLSMLEPMFEYAVDDNIWKKFKVA